MPKGKAPFTKKEILRKSGKYIPDKSTVKNNKIVRDTKSTTKTKDGDTLGQRTIITPSFKHDGHGGPVTKKSKSSVNVPQSKTKTSFIEKKKK